MKNTTLFLPLVLVVSMAQAIENPEYGFDDAGVDYCKTKYIDKVDGSAGVYRGQCS